MHHFVIFARLSHMICIQIGMQGKPIFCAGARILKEVWLFGERQ